MGIISKFRRYAIDVTGLDPLSLGGEASRALASSVLLDVLGR